MSEREEMVECDKDCELERSTPLTKVEGRFSEANFYSASAIDGQLIGFRIAIEAEPHI